MDRLYERLAEILEEDTVGLDDARLSFEQSARSRTFVAGHFGNLMIQARSERPAGQPHRPCPRPAPANPRWSSWPRPRRCCATPNQRLQDPLPGLGSCNE
jgi:hypothetical protein